MYSSQNTSKKYLATPSVPWGVVTPQKISTLDLVLAVSDDVRRIVDEIHTPRYNHAEIACADDPEYRQEMEAINRKERKEAEHYQACMDFFERHIHEKLSPEDREVLCGLMFWEQLFPNSSWFYETEVWYLRKFDMLSLLLVFGADDATIGHAMMLWHPISIALDNIAITWHADLTDDQKNMVFGRFLVAEAYEITLYQTNGYGYTDYGSMIEGRTTSEEEKEFGDAIRDYLTEKAEKQQNGKEEEERRRQEQERLSLQPDKHEHSDEIPL